MAISYEDWKSQYEGMSTDQQAKYAGMVKGNALAEEYANRYIQEKQDAGTFGQKTARSYTNANAPVNTPTQNTPVNTPTRNETTPTTTVTPTPTTRQETPTVIGDTRKETTRTETPVTTVSEIKQEGALTPLSKEYYSQTSDDAQTKIINNLNSYKASNPEYFTDYETFKRNFSYNARNDEQKNTLDTWYKGYSQGLQLSGTPIADLYTQYKNGSISTGDLESLRIANPTKYAELQAQINKGNIIAAYDDDNQTTETMFDQLRNSFLQNMITNLNASGSGASSIFDSYKDKMESPEMTELGDDAAKKQEEIEKVSADIDSMKKQVEKEYEGTGASRAKINAIVADRTYDLQLQLRSLNSEYNRIATQYNNRMNQYQNEFQLQLQEYQINMQERNQKMSELGFAMDLMNYETPEQKQEREWNYWVRQQEYTNGDINSKDYSTRYKAALKSVQNLLAQYPGIPMVRSAEEMAEDVLKGVDAGSTLGAELSNINKLIQQKPEYKKLYNATYGTGSSVIEDTFKSGNTEWVKYNGQWYTSDEFNKIFGSKGKAKAYNQVDDKVLNATSTKYSSVGYNTLGGFLDMEKNQNGKTGGQCGKFVNDYLQYIGVTDAKNRYYDDDLSTKVNSVNTYEPKVGSIAVFDYNHKSSDGINHGHVGIVTKVYNDGSFDVIDSNFDTSKPNTITRRHVQAGQASTKGFFDPSKPSTTASTTDGQVGTAEGRLTLEALKNGMINNSAVPNTIKDLVSQGFSEEDINKALNQNMQYYLPDDQRAEKNAILNRFHQNSIVKEFQDSATQLLSLANTISESSGAADIAAVFQFMKTLDPSSVVREGEFEQAQTSSGLKDKMITTLTKLENGEILTQDQREQFLNTAKKVLEGKKQAYGIAYNETIKELDVSNIPSVYYPTDWVSEIDSIIKKISSNGNTTITYDDLGYDASISSLKSEFGIK